MSASIRSIRSSGHKRNTSATNNDNAKRNPKKAIRFTDHICSVVRKLYSKLRENNKRRPSPSTCRLSNGTLPGDVPDGPEKYVKDAAGPSRPRLAGMSEEEREDWDFGHIRKIEAGKITQLTMKHLEGTYNRVNIVLFEDGTKCTARIPAHDTIDRWTKEDAFALRSQALTMNLIKRKTKVPVPEAIAYSDTCENELGHPYMLTTFLEGKQVFEVWGDQDDYISGAKASETEARRLQILRSLAYTMSELQALSFDAAGGVYFEHDLDDSPKIGTQYDSEDLDFFTRKTSFVPSYNNTSEYLHSKFNEWWDSLAVDNADQVQYNLNRGRSKIMRPALACLPFHKPQYLPSEEASDNEDEDKKGEEVGLKDDKTAIQPDCLEPEERHHEFESDPIDKREVDGSISNEASDAVPVETFVLVPPDFDWQNILVDDDGNVTGLLDWDGICTVPRFEGFASTPI